MLQVGDSFPLLEGKNQEGEIVKLESFLGKPLVVFFYPRASTPTCTIEAKSLRDGYSDLKSRGYEVIGVSADTVAKQKNFHSKNELPYDLIADENQEFVEAFGVWQEKKNFGKTYMGIVRTTFVFDEAGVCIRVIEKVNSREAAAQILENS